MKKSLIVSLLGILSFNVLALDTISLTPEQLCKEYQDGNSSLVQKKYKGKIIKDIGKIEVYYTEEGIYTQAYFSLYSEIIKGNNITSLVGYRIATEENDKEYIDLDGQNKTIFIKINGINSKYYLGKNKCTIDGELIKYE